MDYNFSYKADMAAPVSVGALSNNAKSTEFSKILSVDFGGIYDNLAKQSEANAAKSANEIIDASSLKIDQIGSFNEAGAKFANSLVDGITKNVERENKVIEALSGSEKIMSNDHVNSYTYSDNGEKFHTKLTGNSQDAIRKIISAKNNIQLDQGEDTTRSGFSHNAKLLKQTGKDSSQSR